MVLEVVDRLLQELLERLVPLPAVNADALPGVRGLCGEDPRHLPPRGGNAGEFLVNVPLMAGESGHVGSGIGKGEWRPVFHQHPFHPLGKERFRVGQVADNLQRAPCPGFPGRRSFPGGPGSKLLRRETADRFPNRLDAGEISFDPF